jgi:2-desacetyl-2-hydroxyethyl bacteriochlorophyllide A dehydrogenase
MRVRQAIIPSLRNVEIRTAEIDDQPAPGHLLIETEWTTISPGTEIANYTALDRGVFVPGNWNAYPWLAGYGNVGVVRAVGTGATRATVGQRVFTHGPHASAFHCDAERLVAVVPADVDPSLAAASRMAGVALTGPMAADLGAGRSVAVFGLGMVGNLAAQMCRVMGATVVGIDPSPARQALARRCGIPATLGLGADADRALREMTGGGAQVVIDATGRSDGCAAAVLAAAPYGEIVILGTPRAPLTGDLTAVFNAIHCKWLTVRGALEWNLPHYPTPGLRDSLLSKQQAIFRWIAAGQLDLASLVSHRLPAAEIRTAYEGLLGDPERYTGVLLDWRA